VSAGDALLVDSTPNLADSAAAGREVPHWSDRVSLRVDPPGSRAARARGCPTAP